MKVKVLTCRVPVLLCLLLCGILSSCNQATSIDVASYSEAHDWLKPTDFREVEARYPAGSYMSHMMDCFGKMTCEVKEDTRGMFFVDSDSYNFYADYLTARFNLEPQFDSTVVMTTTGMGAFIRDGELKVKYLGAVMVHEPEDRLYFCAIKSKVGKISSYIYLGREELLNKGFEVDKQTNLLNLGEEKVFNGQFITQGINLPEVHSLQLVNVKYITWIEHHFHAMHKMKLKGPREMIYSLKVQTYISQEIDQPIDGKL